MVRNFLWENLNKIIVAVVVAIILATYSQYASLNRELGGISQKLNDVVTKSDDLGKKMNSLESIVPTHDFMLGELWHKIFRSEPPQRKQLPGETTGTR